MTLLADVLRLSKDMVRVDRPESAKLISVKLHGQGAVRRMIGEGKAPQPFVGNQGRSGQFVLSRIWARRGAMALIPDDLDGVVVTNEFPLFDIDSSRLDGRYFAHQVQTPEFLTRLERASAGASGQNRVKEAAFLALEINLPALDEQRRIAAILDQADTLRAKRRAVIRHYEHLEAAIFHRLFGDRRDPRCRLDALVDHGDRINYGVVQPGEPYPDGVPLIRVSDLRDGRVQRHEIKRINPEIEANYGRSRLRGIEILVSCVGSVGTIALASESDAGSNVARAIARVPISDPTTRAYVAAFLSTDTAQQYFRRELRTVAQPTLNVKELSATQVPLPPVQLQRAFLTSRQSLDAQRATAQRSLSALDELFASLQSRAFTSGL